MAGLSMSVKRTKGVVHQLFTHCRALPVLERYLLAVSLIVLVVTTRIMLQDGSGINLYEYPFAGFHLAVVMISVFIGPVPGLVAGMIAALSAVLAFMPPYWDLHVGMQVNRIELAVFLCFNVILAAVVAVLDDHMKRLKDSEHRMELLFREFRHRSRNDLNSIYALLNLRAREVEDSNAREHLLAAGRHALTLGRVYKRLEQHHYLGGNVLIDAKEFVDGLMDDVIKSQGGMREIGFKVSCEPCQLEFERAIQVGLILNESVTNCLKYAFPEGRSGTIAVSLRRVGSEMFLDVEDDGVGVPNEDTPAKGTGIGTRIIHGLAGQLGGKLERGVGVLGYGTLARLRFPIPGLA